MESFFLISDSRGRLCITVFIQPCFQWTGLFLTGLCDCGPRASNRTMLGSPSSLFLSLKKPGSDTDCTSGTTLNSGILLPFWEPLGYCVSTHITLTSVHLSSTRSPKCPRVKPDSLTCNKFQWRSGLMVSLLGSWILFCSWDWEEDKKPSCCIKSWNLTILYPNHYYHLRLQGSETAGLAGWVHSCWDGSKLHCQMGRVYLWFFIIPVPNGALILQASPSPSPTLPLMPALHYPTYWAIAFPIQDS